MARFQIPEFLFEGFEMLMRMEEEQIQSLANIIDKLPLGISVQDFEKEIKAQGILPDSNPSFSALIYNLGSILLDNEENAAEISEDLVSGFVQSTRREFSSQEEDRLKNYLSIILSHSDRLKKITKINRILSETPLSYNGSRIMTDIRLVFEEDMDANHKSGLIIHQLKIEYLENYKSKSLFFTMKANDLEQLAEVINRALQKESIIKNQYTTTEFIELK